MNYQALHFIILNHNEHILFILILSILLIYRQLFSIFKHQIIQFFIYQKELILNPILAIP